VLRNIRLAIPSGQTLVIIGESGCGKTVMLKDDDRPNAARESTVFLSTAKTQQDDEKELTHERNPLWLSVSGAPCSTA